MGPRFDRMMFAAAAAATIAAPGVAAGKFAPAEGVTYTYSVTDMREAGVFSSDRRVVFHRATQGWTAELTIVSTRVAVVLESGPMAQRMIAALRGRPIRFALNDQGSVVAVEDQDALIKLIVDAVGAAPADNPSATRSAAADRMAKALAALGPDAQRTLLASLLAPMVGGALSEALPGERAIAMPAGSATGQAPAAELTGTEKVSRMPARILIDTTAEGPAPTPGARISIVQHREIDAATGIVLINTRRTETWLTAAPDKKQVVSVFAKVES